MFIQKNDTWKDTQKSQVQIKVRASHICVISNECILYWGGNLGNKGGAKCTNFQLSLYTKSWCNRYTYHNQSFFSSVLVSTKFSQNWYKVITNIYNINNLCMCGIFYVCVRKPNSILMFFCSLNCYCYYMCSIFAPQ